jgi:glycosyltransferase involved in cell wall biosynthesis
MPRRLTVLNVASPVAPIGHDGVGDAGQVVTMLDEALVGAGHRSIVLACEGSTCAGELLTVPTLAGTADADARSANQRHLRAAVHRAQRDLRVDVVHAHGADFFEYWPERGAPLLVTLHLPLSAYPSRALTTNRARTWLNGVSGSQMLGAPQGMRRVADIPHGVRLDRYAPLPQPKRRYAMAIGRICPEKGFDLALEAAQDAGIPMLLAGRITPGEEHRTHFVERIVPRLRAGCRYIGAIGAARKRALLARARCLVVASRIAETSSLAAMEALACGTPVVAFRAGALADIVEHGRTGLLVESVEAMARALKEVDGIDPRACRAAAERSFASTRMTARYLRLYEALSDAAATRVRSWWSS